MSLFSPSTYCPFCRSHDVVPRSVGLKLFGTLGLLAGAAGVLRISIKRLPAGTVSLPGIALSGIAAAVLAALNAGALGCEIGTKAGAQLDRMLLGNRFCRSCKRSFICL